MIAPANLSEFRTRLQEAKALHSERDELIQLYRSMYYMSKKRNSKLLGLQGAWRSQVPSEYWEASSRPANTVNVATSVLSGHYPQFQVTTPGTTNSAVTSRAEKFLQGVLRLNSRRQGKVLHQVLAFRTVLDGGAGIRITWNSSEPARIDTVPIETLEDAEDGNWAVAHYEANNFPIVIEVVPLTKLYPLGTGAFGRPFREIFQVDKRTPLKVEEEWSDVEYADTTVVEKMSETAKRKEKYEYVEWWGEDKEGVWHAVMYKDKYILEPYRINYPVIPYVIVSYHDTSSDDSDESWKEFMSFLFPIVFITEREEYIRSRILRQIDMNTNLNPYHRGSKPVGISGTWGEVVELGDEKSRIEFPTPPGTSPDVVRYLDDLMGRSSEGTFSQAMFGQVSSRLSGYGLSQLIGTDALRLDLPRAALELGLGAAADVIFALLRRFSENTHLSVIAQFRNRTLSAMLSGAETALTVVDAFVKPKQPSDDVRMATLGAQLAANPNSPVSKYYILQEYFGIAQPEDEIATKLQEEAQADPLVRTLAVYQALVESQSPYAAIVAQQLQTMMQPPMPQGGPPQPTEGFPGQLPPGAIMGNPPVVQYPGQDVTEEANMFGPQANMFGGPPE